MKLNSEKRARLIVESPAIGEMSMRATGMKRPTITAVPPCRSKNPRVRASTTGLTRRECRSKKVPPRRPAMKATVVPPAAVSVETTKRTASDNRPCAANAAAVITVVSVGKGIAIPSKKMNTPTMR